MSQVIFSDFPNDESINLIAANLDDCFLFLGDCHSSEALAANEQAFLARKPLLCLSLAQDFFQIIHIQAFGQVPCLECLKEASCFFPHIYPPKAEMNLGEKQAKVMRILENLRPYPAGFIYRFDYVTGDIVQRLRMPNSPSCRLCSRQVHHAVDSYRSYID